MEHNTIVYVILTLFGLVVLPGVGFLWKIININRQELSNTKTDFLKYKLEVSQSYVSKEDINPKFDKIDASLTRIYEKLDKIVEKMK